MACAMVYWGNRYERFEQIFLPFGAVADIRHLHTKSVGAGEQPSFFDSEPIWSTN